MQRSRGKASRKLDTGEKSPCQRDLRNKETPEKTNTAKSSGQMDQLKEEKDSEEAEGQYMTTSEVYLCCCQQPPASPLLESPVKKEEEEVASKCLAQIYDFSCKHDSQILMVKILLQSHHGGKILWIHCWRRMLSTFLR